MRHHEHAVRCERAFERGMQAELNKLSWRASEKERRGLQQLLLAIT